MIEVRGVTVIAIGTGTGALGGAGVGTVTGLYRLAGQALYLQLTMAVDVVGIPGTMITMNLHRAIGTALAIEMTTAITGVTAETGITTNGIMTAGLGARVEDDVVTEGLGLGMLPSFRNITQD